MIVNKKIKQIIKFTIKQIIKSIIRLIKMNILTALTIKKINYDNQKIEIINHNKKIYKNK